MQTLVLEHMREEQVHVLPLLHDLEDDIRRSELGERYLRAMAAAHTHPHPHLPNAAPGNVIAGPLAALVDRFRDTFDGGPPEFDRKRRQRSNLLTQGAKHHCTNVRCPNERRTP